MLGLVIAALIAAFMSTISTHLNWGASYVVHDFYKRFVDEEASEKKLVNLGRITTVILMIMAGIIALLLSNALQAFNILLQIGAGTGLIFILRWFWWRINAYSEIAAMVISFLVAWYFEQFYEGSLEPQYRLLVGVLITTAGWIIVTFLTRPTDSDTLASFVTRIRPHQVGWRHVIAEKGISIASDNKITDELAGMLYGCMMVYGALFAVGMLIYGEITTAIPLLILVGLATWRLIVIWKKLKFY